MHSTYFSRASKLPVASSRRGALRTVCSATKDDQIAIMVNSCTGKMGLATAEAVVRAGCKLVPFTFTGRSRGVSVSKQPVMGIPVEIVAPEERQSALDSIRAQYPNMVVIDYTLPGCVNDNARFYCKNQLPFVMGTTGGDREALLKEVSDSGNYAVIAPQMGKQIVAFQAMMEYMGQNYPGAFNGYSLEVIESHQKTKVDTSGTAKAVIKSFNDLGIPFTENQIKKVRDEDTQVSVMGVPRSALDGHAFHTYRLTSGDGSVTFEFQHNVRGRVVYAEGTVDAAMFLAKQIEKKADKKLYNMIDVLRAGAMRSV